MSQLLPSWHFSTLFLVVGRLIQPDSIFCVTQSHKCRVWKGPTPAKAVSYSRLHWKALRQLLNIPREGDTTTSLGNLFQCSTTLKVKKLFLMFIWNFPCSSLCPLPLVLLLGTTERSLASFSWLPYFRYLNVLFQSETNPNSKITSVKWNLHFLHSFRDPNFIFL